MIPFFPRQISYKAILVYIIALVVVSIMYSGYIMKLEYIVIGVLSVVGFFLLVSEWSSNWTRMSEKRFLNTVFTTALVLRLIWVIFSYFYYSNVNGTPFEYGAADSMGYHDEAAWLASESWLTIWSYYFGPEAYGVSDVGYPLYLTILYKIFGPVIVIPRIIKAFLSAFLCILLYRLSNRTFGESVARIAAIMCVLMPNLIIYCGYHLKETEMLFMEVAFLERLDYMIRGKKITFWNVVLTSLLLVSLFFFRTVMGATGIFVFATTVLFSSTPSLKRGWKRTAYIAWGVLCLVVASGGTIVTEIEGYWEGRSENVVKQRLEQTSRGNQWAQYATGTVMAPMIVVLPFATMVDVDQQYGQQEKHGGNFIRNFMGLFVILAVYEAFRRKQWRNFVTIGSFAVAYLGIISLSGFSNSERFLLPGLPCLIMMWAYGISALRDKTYKLLNPWCVVVCVMEIAWAYFKLGSRGLF